MSLKEREKAASEDRKVKQREVLQALIMQWMAIYGDLKQKESQEALREEILGIPGVADLFDQCITTTIHEVFKEMGYRRESFIRASSALVNFQVSKKWVRNSVQLTPESRGYWDNDRALWTVITRNTNPVTYASLASLISMLPLDQQESKFAELMATVKSSVIRVPKYDFTHPEYTPPIKETTDDPDTR